MNHVRATGIAAFALGVGLAGHPFDWLGAAIAAVLLAILVIAFERRGGALQVFLTAFLGVIFASMLQHAGFGPSERPAAVATQLYFGVYPGTIVVAFGLALLATASLGRKDAPLVIAGIGTVVGILLFLLL